MEMLATEAELNNVVAHPGMVQVDDDNRVLPVRQGDESDEEETHSYMDELVMVSKDNANIFGPEAVNEDAIDNMENAFICEPMAESNDAVYSALEIDEDSDSSGRE